MCVDTRMKPIDLGRSPLDSLCLSYAPRQPPLIPCNTIDDKPYTFHDRNMPKAYTVTSDPFFINANVTETGVDTYTEVSISAPLDSLNQEGLLIHAVYFSGNEPDRVANAESSVFYQLTSTSKPGRVFVNDANLIAAQQKIITGGAAEFSGPHNVDLLGSNDPYQSEDNLMIVATDDLFLAVQGFGQAAVKSCQVRIVASRIKLTASAYAALVTNELSS